MGARIDHVALEVGDLITARPFFDAVLGVLGLPRVFTLEDRLGYGQRDLDGYLSIIVGPGRLLAGHLALRAPSRDAVDAFHAAAVAHGGQDDGAPGARPEYGPGYYAAFVMDPWGNRLEAVHRG